jgi:DNA-binding NtrC family response regulator
MPQDSSYPFVAADMGEPRDGEASGVLLRRAPHAGVADQEQAQREGVSARDPRADRQLFARYGVARLLDERGEMRPIGVLEEEVIRFAIGHYRGRMSEVARRLGIGRSTLYRKIKDYGIALSDPVAS